MSLPKAIQVSCAIIEHKKQILITQRGPGSSFSGYWEFPGGKRHPGETGEACLIREIEEELGVWVAPRLLLHEMTHVRPDKTLHLSFYLCSYLSGRPVRRGVYNFCWATPRELKKFLFLPADTDIINELILREAWLFRDGYLSEAVKLRNQPASNSD